MKAGSTKIIGISIYAMLKDIQRISYTQFIAER